jgi:glutamate 5-kinase
MLHALPTSGRIVVDEGAAQALRTNGASLLPSGVVSVEGSFAQGDAVEVMVATDDGPSPRIAKGITQYGTDALRRIQGRQTHALNDILGDVPADHVIHRDDLVLVD